MSIFSSKVCDLTILAGQQFSQTLDADQTIGDAFNALLMFTAGQGVDDTTPYSIQISSKRAVDIKSDSDWMDLVNDLGLIELPRRGQAKLIQVIAGAFRIKAAASVTQDAVFGITKQFA